MELEQEAAEIRADFVGGGRGSLRGCRLPALRRGGRALGSPRIGRLNPAWTAGFRGPSFKVRPRSACGPRPAPWSRAAMPSTTRFLGSPSTRPPRRRDTRVVGTNTGSAFLESKLASPRHRGRDDARGHHPCGAPGSTRTSGRPAGAPIRDRRRARLRLAPLERHIRGNNVIGTRTFCSRKSNV